MLQNRINLDRFKAKNEFSRNILTLMMGTTIAQAIPIVVSPILTRLYSPEDFGVLALFVALTSILSSIVNGKYELAISLPEKDEDAINILAVGFLVNIVISLIILLIILIFHFEIAHLLKNAEIGHWLYFIPFVVFLMGLFNLLYYFNNRQKQFKDLRNSTIIKSIAVSIIQIGAGFLKLGAYGLISGQIISILFANIKLIKNVFRDRKLINSVTFQRAKFQAKKYIHFPKYLIVGHSVNTISGQLHIVMFSNLFSANVLGFLSLAQKLLGIPLGLVAQSVGNVFLQEASLIYNKQFECVKLYKNTFKKLLLLSFMPFLILYFTAPSLFGIVFGAKWTEAGKYVQILIPMYFLQFITNPLSTMLFVAQKQKIDLIWQIYRLLVVLISIFVGYYIFNSIYMTLFLFSLAHSSAYMILGIITYHIAKG